MSISATLHSTSLLLIFSDIPTTRSSSLLTSSLEALNKNLGPSSNTSLSAAYLNNINQNRKRSLWTSSLTALFTLLVIASFSAYAFLGQLYLIASSALLGCLLITSFARLIITIKNLRNLVLSKKRLSDALMSISKKISSTQDTPVAMKKFNTMQGVAYSVKKAISKQISLQKFSLTGSILAIISIITLIAGISILLINSYTSYSIASNPVFGIFSITQLILFASGLVFGMSMLINTSFALISCTRAYRHTQIHNKIEKAMDNLGLDIRNDISTHFPSKTS
ncbi:hypothetical protein CLAVI_000423 [Candidatus Clavichlamydia salmonicola]|uniref:hypothetical protein n=1 Tax=Candidatus Clavichlamydia salmonicola TaxID=469812 RepID=UPI0018911EC8|nr:hypothetical protein [Candidatus Clavichlamydia salmonicola]MBF5050804.1 hypothetical protein [Candidatus Clavichlamydia salmonicola]